MVFSIMRYKTDESFLSGALRETQEELGINPDQIEVLGEIGPPETNLRGDMTVWPFVASPSTEFQNVTCSNMDKTGVCSLGVRRKPSS